MKNLFIYDLNIYKLIKNYFSMYLNKKLISSYFIYRKKKFLSLNKVYISKPEIKHINSRAIITIYVYNKEKLSNTNNIKNKRIKYLLNILKKLIKKLETIFINKVDFNDKSTFLINLFLFKNVFKLKILKKLNYIRRIKIKFSINEYKFKSRFLSKLGTLVAKFYKKKIEFNIINLKSIRLNPDIFTEYLRLKLRKNRRSVLRRMNYIVNNIKLPNVNTKIERARLPKSINFNLLENKYKNLNLNSILNKNSLDQVLRNLFKKIQKNIIFNNFINFLFFIFFKIEIFSLL